MPDKDKAVNGTAVVSDEDKKIGAILQEVRKRVTLMAENKNVKEKQITFKQELELKDIRTFLDGAHQAALKNESTTALRSAKTVFDRTLEGVQTIGSIVASAASFAVGEPANMCYNALTFVICVYQGYNGIFESLAQLLVGFVGFFGRFENYITIERLDIKLKLVACEQLNLFVDICDYALNLRHSTFLKAKAVVKIFLFKDDGVQGFMQRMQCLDKEESGLIQTETLAVAHNLDKTLQDSKNSLKDWTKTFEDWKEHVMKSLIEQLEDRVEQRAEKDTKKWKQMLVRVLVWPEEDLKVSSDEKVPTHVWESSWQRHMAKKTVEGAGGWLDSHKVFNDWAEGKTSDAVVLGIEGAEGTGKSQLTANIITRLKQKHGQSSPVAYYFLERDSKGDAASKSDTLATVTRSLIWQLAEPYLPFLKSAAGICDNKQVISDPFEMWKHILVENKDRANWNTTFFIILDGFIEEDHAKSLKKLLSLLKKSPDTCRKTRILLTGTSEWLAQLGPMKSMGLQTIKLGDENPKDIELFIEDRMNQMELLKDSSNNKVSQVRQRVVDALKKATGGDYRKLDTVLTEISEKENDQEIDSCLTRAGNAAAKQITAIMQKINRKSSPQEISDMNEMVIWVTYGRGLTPLQLEGALALKNRASATTKSATSEEPQTHEPPITLFTSLESKIKKRKFSLFDLTETAGQAVVTFAGSIDAEEAKKRLLKANEPHGDGEAQHFHPTEVDMIEHYLKTVCPDDVYKKFGFEEFLSQKRVRNQNRIFLDPGNAEITLALRCLQCLVEGSTEKTKLLHDYAADQLYHHLWAAEHRDPLDGSEKDGYLSMTDRDLRSRIGILLVQLFVQGHAIDSLFGLGRSFGDESKSVMAQRSFPQSWEPWIQADRGAHLMKTYFRDRAILQNINESDLAKAQSVANSNKTLPLLDSATKMALTSKYAQDPEEYDRFWNPTIDVIDAVETWSSNLATEKGPESVWEAHMAMILLRLNRNQDEHVTREHVETRARKAFNMDQENWKASYVLAEVTESEDEAVEILEGITKRLSANERWTGDTNKRKLLAEMYLDLGDKSWTDLPRQPRAIAAYSDSIKMDASHHQRYHNVISHYADRKLWKEIASLMEMLLKGPKQGLATPIGNLVAEWASFSSFNANIMQTVQALDRWDLLKAAYEEGIKAATDAWTTLWVRYNYGTALRKSPVTALQDEGLRIWETILDQEGLSRRTFVGRHASNLLVPKLMPIYTKGALAEAQGDLSISSSVSEFTFAGKIDRLSERFRSLRLNYRAQKNGLYFARYYFLTKQMQLAKASIKDLLEQSLDMMSNDDPSDDFICFWQLQTIFTTFEDDTNALAAWKMMAVAKREMYNEYFEELHQWQDKVARWEAQESPDVGRQNGAGVTAESEEGDRLAEVDATDEKSSTEMVSTKENPQKPVEPNFRFGVFCDGCGFIVQEEKYISRVYGTDDRLLKQMEERIRARESEDLVDILFKSSCHHKDKPDNVESNSDDDSEDNDDECRYCDKSRIKSRKPAS
ncbi:hypothetical protein CBS470a_008995 [Colletotrichum nupharicola]|nr:hypothetical protein CBS470a_008995 [Colletotrichum nupharicola]